MTMICKTQNQRHSHLKRDYYYSAARNAMKDFIARVAVEKSSFSPTTVLLPSYIGVSPKEGSGIFDPIVELSDKGLIDFSFYRMTNDLRIDVTDVARIVRDLGERTFIFLQVNYFGFVDPSERIVYKIVKNAGGIVLEDNAHSFFTYHYRQNHYCDACFFSLHKQFPFEQGGMLRITNDALTNLSYSGSKDPSPEADPWIYDFRSISQTCRNNFLAVQELMDKNLDLWTPIRTLSSYDYTVPQTFPIALLSSDRFKVYLDMNELGFGATSLYHTLIEPLRDDPRFEESRRLAACVLNLPVHQDVDASLYPDLIDSLKRSCRTNGIA
ncbi:hypothetical protein H8S61_04655 [Eggerthella sp. NSJ-70]|uniref:DegT/DnrJ/EryC1/StrS aminotransferase family protein n=1 Tax=Eggerthella hominis TaxID=2763043 RepID=A0ABR7BPG9_9ACTN|nr:hypothetical protein [Eggerthella hominis]MBC5583484.1 hypothetical protein [Eggerthella hominis]